LYNYRKLKKEIKEKFLEAEKEYDECETESAPSGEWAEYNIHYLELQAQYYAWEEAYEIVKRCKF